MEERQKCRYTRKEIALIKSMFNEGKSTQEIGLSIGRSRNAVTCKLIRMKLKKARSYKADSFQNNQCNDLRNTHKITQLTRGI
jgi:hypothetical protein